MMVASTASLQLETDETESMTVCGDEMTPEYQRRAFPLKLQAPLQGGWSTDPQEIGHADHYIITHARVVS
jgi:hypothetical protein